MLKAIKEKFKEPKPGAPEVEPATEVLFLCSYQGCGKTFIDAGVLKKHSHIHEEKQYVCHHEGCGSKFLDISKLKRYFLIYTGERSFVCPHEGFGKAFSLDFNLKAHMGTHSQENYFLSIRRLQEALCTGVQVERLLWIISTTSLSNPIQTLPNFLLIINRFFSHSASSIHVTYQRFHHHHLPTLLPLCSASPAATPPLKAVHALVVTTSEHLSVCNVFLYNNLISAYGAIGDMWAARRVFDEMRERNVVSYNSVISVYAHGFQDREAIRMFLEMMKYGYRPTQFTFSCLLHCLTLACGIQLQTLILKTGHLCSNAFSGTALLDVFRKYNCLEHAVKLFREIPVKNVATCNVMMDLYFRNGKVEDSFNLFKELFRTGCELSEYTFVCGLSAICSVEDFTLGVQVHGLIVKVGMVVQVIVMNSLINFYEKCCSVLSAKKIFEEMPIRDIVSWNSMIMAYSKSDKPEKALSLLLDMSICGFYPSQATFVSVINSCTKLKALPCCGQYIHAKAIKRNIIYDIIVGSSLVDFHVKCYDLEGAHTLFDEMDETNIVTWNTLIWGYANVNSSHAVILLKKLLSTRLRPNQGSFSAVLKSASLLEVQQIHAMIEKVGHSQNDYVASSLMSSYAYSGLDHVSLAISELSPLPLSVVHSNIIARIYQQNDLHARAKQVLLEIGEPDIISWNTLIGACTRSGEYKEAFQLFKQMQLFQVLADKCTYTSLLYICSRLCSLALGGTLHGLILKTNVSFCDTFLQNMLVDMYSKCGFLEGSIQVFKDMTARNIISWTALISGFARHGMALKALESFNEMELQGFIPDRVAFVAVLSACRNGGLVEEGIRVFEKMNKFYDIKPNMDHYACVVDMLCRGGQIKEAEQVICGMPFRPSTIIWRCFLEGSKRCGWVKGILD